ncbi:MAG: hypothetical protein JWO08_4124 [Verrucomicrobiaceae bacterium]|nr:hypothetical protein [Verrucomicrobiaceae bacterium]
MIDPALLDLLACPMDGSPLRVEGDHLVSTEGTQYPVINGVPVLLPPDASRDTLACVHASRAAAASGREDALYIDALGCNGEERQGILKLAASGSSKVDPVVNYLVAATCGNLYKHLIGRLNEYPIPKFRETNGHGRVMVDLRCNWGRWCVAAGREGFKPLGIDPQLGALMSAKRVTRQLGIDAWFVCGDARSLPLRAGSVDLGFSYSVLQHLSHEDVALVLQGLARAMKPGAESLIQMPTRAGLKGWLHRARHGFKEPSGFEVRYWTQGQLKETFVRLIGPSHFSVDCFFGIGLQAADAPLMPLPFKAAIAASEGLRRLSQWLPPVTWAADSVYVHSRKNS